MRKLTPLRRCRLTTLSGWSVIKLPSSLSISCPPFTHPGYPPWPVAANASRFIGLQALASSCPGTYVVLSPILGQGFLPLQALHTYRFACIQLDPSIDQARCKEHPRTLSRRQSETFVRTTARNPTRWHTPAGNEGPCCLRRHAAIMPRRTPSSASHYPPSSATHAEHSVPLIGPYSTGKVLIPKNCWRSLSRGHTSCSEARCVLRDTHLRTSATDCARDPADSDASDASDAAWHDCTKDDMVYNMYTTRAS